MDTAVRLPDREKMEEVMELGESQSRRERGVKMGRRARASQDPLPEERDTVRSQPGEEAPPRPLRQGGWADDSSGPSKPGKHGAEDVEE
ncbi:intraflagellar transport protein 43 homolog [Ascaphus truei]|uniref:intraflagellar transport protein 43 homolog n=1 Tax=Ascaphus truei TaxID=8439 RepID=UPI003F598FD2